MFKFYKIRKNDFGKQHQNNLISVKPTLFEHTDNFFSPIKKKLVKKVTLLFIFRALWPLFIINGRNCPLASLFDRQ